MSDDAARNLRLIGLIGLAASLLCWVWAQRSPARKGLLWSSQIAAVAFALIFVVGAFAGAESEGRRVLPRFP